MISPWIKWYHLRIQWYNAGAVSDVTLELIDVFWGGGGQKCIKFYEEELINFSITCIRFVYMWFQNARFAFFFFKIISWVPLLQDRKRPAPSSFYKGKPPKLCTLQLHMISAMPITIATPKAFSCYRFLMLGIPWTQSMPSCDVNAAMRLAEANWMRDKGYLRTRMQMAPSAFFGLHHPRIHCIRLLLVLAQRSLH